MAESRVSLCLKYLIFFFNFFFWIVGCLMIGVGTWAYLHKSQFSFSDRDKGAFDYVFDAAVVMVCIGVCVFILAFAGCIGSLRENLCMLRFFYISLIVVFLAELTAAVLAFVFSETVKQKIQEVMQEEALTRYRDDPDLMNMIDFFQREVGCCGIGPEGYTDWNINPYFQCTDNNTAAERCSVPFSCCIQPVREDTQAVDTMCGYGTLKKQPFDASKVIYITGCMDRAMYLARTNLIVVGSVAITVAVLQIVSILMARTLDDQISDQMTSYDYQY